MLDKVREIASELHSKSWQRKLLDEAKRTQLKASEKVLAETYKRRERIRETYELKKRLIYALREPARMFGEEMILIRTDNHLLAHDVVRELGIELKRSAQYDGFNYEGKYNDIKILIFGAQTAGKCKLVRKVKLVTKKEISYESVCR